MRNTFSRPGSASCIPVTFRSKESTQDDALSSVEGIEADIAQEDYIEEEEN